jgi:hypothetical protein
VRYVRGSMYPWQRMTTGHPAAGRLLSGTLISASSVSPSETNDTTELT